MNLWHELAYVIPVFLFAFNKDRVFICAKYVMICTRVNAIENLRIVFFINADLVEIFLFYLTKPCPFVQIKNASKAVLNISPFSNINTSQNSIACS
jgi:hypothetical protein